MGKWEKSVKIQKQLKWPGKEEAEANRAGQLSHLVDMGMVAAADTEIFIHCKLQFHLLLPIDKIGARIAEWLHRFSFICFGGISATCVVDMGSRHLFVS